MAYRELFERVARHVEAQGVAVEFEMGTPPSAEALREARRRLGVPLPQSLVEFFSEVGEKARLRWNAGKVIPPTEEIRKLEEQLTVHYGRPYRFQTEHEDGPNGGVLVYTLDDVVTTWEQDVELAAKYDGSYVEHADDPTLARLTTMRMRHWLKFHEEGNGDAFCLDTRVRPERVVYHEHDWSGTNGDVMGETLHDFFAGWAGVCFQDPISMWWTSVMREGRVDWGAASLTGGFDYRGTE